MAGGWDSPNLESVLVKIRQLCVIRVNDGAVLVCDVVRQWWLSLDFFDRTCFESFLCAFQSAAHVDEILLQERVVFENFAVFKLVVIFGWCALDDFADKTGLNSGGWVLLDLVDGKRVGHVNGIVVWGIIVDKCLIWSRILVC